LKILHYFSLLLFLFGCSGKQNTVSNNYFDINGLFKMQISNLIQEKPIFIKSVQLNGQNETKELVNINWQKELEPFSSADINKPAFTTSYTSTETDTSLIYTLKNGEKQPIKSINISKRRNEKEINGIEIISADENFLYHWSKIISANFKNGMLQNYSVKGEQKILIFDRENFVITSQRK
jgi:hypothetical protein